MASEWEKTAAELKLLFPEEEEGDSNRSSLFFDPRGLGLRETWNAYAFASEQP